MCGRMRVRVPRPHDGDPEKQSRRKLHANRLAKHCRIVYTVSAVSHCTGTSTDTSALVARGPSLPGPGL